MKRLVNANRDFWIESAAGGLTLAGIYIGSTTAAGAGCYLGSLVFWFWMMFRKRVWGLAPLNCATLVIASLNLWRAL